MKPESQAIIIQLSGRLNAEHGPRPEHVVMPTLVAIKNVGVPHVPLTLKLLNLNYQCKQGYARYSI